MNEDDKLSARCRQFCFATWCTTTTSVDRLSETTIRDKRPFPGQTTTKEHRSQAVVSRPIHEYLHPLPVIRH
jgi:hypothetical protein